MLRLRGVALATVLVSALATACSFILDVEPAPPPPPPDDDAAAADAAPDVEEPSDATFDGEVEDGTAPDADVDADAEADADDASDGADT